jgi:hypothetical protein
MNARSLWRKGSIQAVVVAGLLGLAACLPVPLGDPAKAKLDPRLTGVWEWHENGQVQLAVFRPYDEHTYIVDGLTGEPGEGDAIKPLSREMLKGWLTTVKGETFLTMESLQTVGSIPGETRQKYFIVARIKIEGDVITATGIDPEYAKLKEIGTSTALERMISENIDDPKMYLKPIMATKWDNDQVVKLEKIQDAFKDWKRP